MNLGYEEEWKSQNKTRGEKANGKEQNTSGSIWQKFTDELFQAKRGIGDA